MAVQEKGGHPQPPKMVERTYNFSNCCHDAGEGDLMHTSLSKSAGSSLNASQHSLGITMQRPTSNGLGNLHCFARSVRLLPPASATAAASRSSAGTRGRDGIRGRDIATVAERPILSASSLSSLF